MSTHHARNAVIALPLTSHERTLLQRIRDQECTRSTDINGVAQLVLHLALLNWSRLQPILAADAAYMADEGFPDLGEMYSARLKQAAQQKELQP